MLVDNDASNKAADADEALQLLGADVAGWAYVTATITVSHRDPRIADARLKAVEKIVQGRDFTCIPESLNALEAWLGSLPGHAYANVRQPPISTLNLAHMIPLSAVWAGPEANEHLGGPPLFFARTEGSTPFRFSSHVGDVGHTLVVGPTGAGKSVLLAFMALQFRRYPQAQVFAFDFGGSIRAATLAMGGDWHDLGGGLAGNDGAANAAPSLQPLARIDEPGERAWAAEWLAGVLTREGVAVGPEIKELLWSALASLASAPVSERTLTGLTVLLQSSALKQALQPYTLDGPWGRLLDGDHEALGTGSVQAFETEGLVGTAAAAAVLAYLFHRIGDRLTGAPTMIIVDEGWLALDDAEFGRQLREWLKTLRKKNASVVFATQSLADIDGSAIAPGDHRELPDPAVPAQRARARAADRRDLPAVRAERPPARDRRAGDAEARLLLPEQAGQPAVRARPERCRAGVHRRLVARRPDRHRAAARRAWPRRVRGRVAAPPRPRLGGRAAARRRAVPVPADQEILP